MTVIEMCQKVALDLAKANGSFNATEVQSRIGDGTKLVHISYVRTACHKLVASGLIKVVGEGKNRKYASPNFDYTAPEKKTKTANGQPRSAMRILDATESVLADVNIEELVDQI